MSPLLFILVREYLHVLTKQVVDTKKLELYMARGIMVELQLALADDITLFYRAFTKSFQALIDILGQFSQYFGLQINKVKSSVIVSSRVHDGVVLATILGFQQKTLLVNYLGVPLTGKSISHTDYNSLIADLQEMLACWSTQALSYMERESSWYNGYSMGNLDTLCREATYPRAHSK